VHLSLKRTARTDSIEALAFAGRHWTAQDAYLGRTWYQVVRRLPKGALWELARCAHPQAQDRRPGSNIAPPCSSPFHPSYFHLPLSHTCAVSSACNSRLLGRSATPFTVRSNVQSTPPAAALLRHPDRQLAAQQRAWPGRPGGRGSGRQTCGSRAAQRRGAAASRAPPRRAALPHPRARARTRPSRTWPARLTHTQCTALVRSVAAATERPQAAAPRV